MDKFIKSSKSRALLASVISAIILIVCFHNCSPAKHLGTGSIAANGAVARNFTIMDEPQTCPIGGMIFYPDTGTSLGDPNYDARPAVQAAIDKAEAETCVGRKIVMFKVAPYRLKCPQTKTAHLVIKGKDITLQGQSTDSLKNTTTFEFSDFTCDGISVHGAENFKIDNFKIKYSKLPFTQGTITKVDSENGKPFIEVDFSPNFSLPDADGLFTGLGKGNAVWGFVAKRNQFYNYQVVSPCVKASECAPEHFQFLEGRKYRIYERIATDLDKFVKATNVKVGATYVQVSRYFKSPLSFERNKGLVASNVSILMSSGVTSHLFANEGGAVGTEFENLTFKNYKIMLDPAYPERILSSVADGIHSLGNYAPIVIQDSYFEGTADDAVAFNLRGGVVASIDGTEAKELILSDAKNAFFKVGDNVTLLDTSTATRKCSGDIASAVMSGDSTWRLGIAADDCAIGMNVQNLKAFNTNMSAALNTVERTNFRKFRGGMRVVTSALIQDNFFYNGGAYRIIVGANLGNAGYSTVSLPNNVNVLRNKFYGAPASTDPKPSIETSEISVYLKGSDASTYGSGISNVKIQGNYFLNVPELTANINNCNNCQVIGNTIQTTLASAGETEGRNRQAVGPHIFIGKSFNVHAGKIAPVQFKDVNGNPENQTNCGIEIETDTCASCSSNAAGEIGGSVPLTCESVSKPPT